MIVDDIEFARGDQVCNTMGRATTTSQPLYATVDFSHPQHGVSTSHVLSNKDVAQYKYILAVTDYVSK